LAEPAPDISDTVVVANAFLKDVALTAHLRSEVAAGLLNLQSPRLIPLLAQIWPHILEGPLASSSHQVQESQECLCHETL